jgi:hypothetical protein
MQLKSLPWLTAMFLLNTVPCVLLSTLMTLGGKQGLSGWVLSGERKERKKLPQKYNLKGKFDISMEDTMRTLLSSPV